MSFTEPITAKPETDTALEPKHPEVILIGAGVGAIYAYEMLKAEGVVCSITKVEKEYVIESPQPTIELVEQAHKLFHEFNPNLFRTKHQNGQKNKVNRSKNKASRKARKQNRR